jgi:hypothetical protein
MWREVTATCVLLGAVGCSFSRAPTSQAAGSGTATPPANPSGPSVADRIVERVTLVRWSDGTLAPSLQVAETSGRSDATVHARSNSVTGRDAGPADGALALVMRL